MREDKAALQQELTAKLEDFVKKGGTIQKIPPGISGSVTKTNQMTLPINVFKNTTFVEPPKKNKQS